MNEKTRKGEAMKNKYAKDFTRDLKRLEKINREVKMRISRIDQQEMAVTMNRIGKLGKNQFEMAVELLRKKYRRIK